MFFTLALFRKGIPGKQWIGKHRRPRQITWQMKRNMIKRLEQEAANEYWISRPYLTMEQERGSAVERRERTWQQMKSERQAKFPEHVYAAEHLNHLKICKFWPD